ncbi:MAG: virulence protein, partial [Lachnospiraceae bacterium]|nr:virulence protein [Lachnospiraceae bacterium]
MKINYNVTGTRRKELARVISQITGAKAEYQYMPTCAYVIDFFTLSKEGMLEFSDRSDTEIVEEVLEGIAAAGFECEAAENADEIDEEETIQTSDEAETETPQADELTEALDENKDVEDAPAEDTCSEAPWLTISLPLDKVDAGKLTRILEAKGNLIKKALGVDDLPIEIGEDTISFPWFQEL